MFSAEANRTIENVAKAIAIDPELGKELYAQYRQRLQPPDTFHLYRNVCVKYAYAFSSIDPIAARLIIETQFARALNLARHGVQRDMRIITLAMCTLDPDRAQAMLDAVTKLNIPDRREPLPQLLIEYLLMPAEKRVSWLFFNNNF